MKIVLAFDSYKECMSAIEACQYAKSVLKNHDVIMCPMSDGGEGTRDVVVLACNGVIKDYYVKDVFLNDAYVGVGIIGDCAIIESAKVCGLELTQGIRNPHRTSTYGLGELIIKLMDEGIRKIVVTLGGSATNDGGIGMLSALGVSFYNQNKERVMMMDDLKDIDHIDISQIYKRIYDIDLKVLCDVDNPLCGETGATYTYGRQKGLLEHELLSIDEAMRHYASLSYHLLGSDDKKAGCGAAGGLGFAFCYYLKAKLVPGLKTISELLKLEDHIQDCDVIFVGEGMMDRSSLFGKSPYGVLNIAKQYNKKVYAYVGKVNDYDLLKDIGFQDIFEISKGIDLQTALKNGQYYLKKAIIDNIKEIEKDVYR